MSDLFETDDENSDLEMNENFEPIDPVIDFKNANLNIDRSNLDARRRLESMLDEKRLHNELQDW